MNKNGTKKTYIVWGLLLMVLLIVFDRITKIAALKRLKDQDPIILLEGIFELNYLENRGVAFGLFQNQRLPILVLVVIILFGIGYFLYKLPATKRYLPLHIIFIAVGAGAIGNMYDRIVYGFVVDFFYFSLIDFPVFNVADICVTVSAFILLLFVLFYYKEEDFAFLSKKIQVNPENITNTMESNILDQNSEKKLSGEETGDNQATRNAGDIVDLESVGNKNDMGDIHE